MMDAMERFEQFWTTWAGDLNDAEQAMAASSGWGVVRSYMRIAYLAAASESDAMREAIKVKCAEGCGVSERKSDGSRVCLADACPIYQYSPYKEGK